MAVNWSPIKTMAVKMDTDIKADGTIAKSGDTVGGKKTITIQGIATDSSVAQAATVFDAFVGTIGEGVFDSLTAHRSFSSGVE